MNEVDFSNANEVLMKHRSLINMEESCAKGLKLIILQPDVTSKAHETPSLYQ